MRLGFIIFAFIALFGEFIANERPLYCVIQGKTYFPALQQQLLDWGSTTSDTTFFKINWATFSDYDRVIKAPIPFSAKTIGYQAFLPPFRSIHFLGTDRLGRDVFAGLIYGTKSAFFIGVGATLFALVIGAILGFISGYFEGFIDMIIIQIINIKRALPTLLWLMTLTAVINKCNYFQFILIISLLSWTTFATLLRGEVLKVKHQDFIIATKTLGLMPGAIIWKHLLPNSLPILYTTAAIMVKEVILGISALSFLGIGLSIEEVTWGSMINQASSDISVWWMAIFPGICLFGVIYLFSSYAEKSYLGSTKN
jgi:peptide/nickel transport system permease protein